MTKQRFKDYINLSKGIFAKSTEAQKLGIDLSSYEESYYTLIELLEKEVFGVWGWDHVSEFLYMRNSKEYTEQNPICWDKETKKAEYWDVDSLYDYLVRSEYIKVK